MAADQGGRGVHDPRPQNPPQFPFLIPQFDGQFRSRLKSVSSASPMPPREMSQTVPGQPKTRKAPAGRQVACRSLASRTNVRRSICAIGWRVGGGLAAGHDFSASMSGDDGLCNRRTGPAVGQTEEMSGTSHSIPGLEPSLSRKRAFPCWHEVCFHFVTESRCALTFTVNDHAGFLLCKPDQDEWLPQTINAAEGRQGLSRLAHVPYSSEFAPDPDACLNQPGRES